MRLAPVAERSPGVQIAGELRQSARDLDLDRDDADRAEGLLGGPGGMVSAATTHRARRTAADAERLRAELAVLDALEQGRLSPFTVVLGRTCERRENRFPLRLGRLRLDRRGHRLVA